MPVRPLMLGAPLLAVALSACSSITPITISLPKGETHVGTAWTNTYTGTFSAGPCQGSFNGPLERPEVIIAMQCVGRRGTGMGVRDGSTFVGGTVALNNGTTATISGPGLTPSTTSFPRFLRPEQAAGRQRSRTIRRSPPRARRSVSGWSRASSPEPSDRTALHHKAAPARSVRAPIGLQRMAPASCRSARPAI